MSHRHILIGALILQLICIVSCWETNQDIEKVKDPDAPSRIRTAPIFWLCVVAVMIADVLIF